MTSRIAITILVAALAWGCGELNPAYCREHPDDVDCPRIDAGIDIDAPIVACDSPDDCLAPTPVCKLATQTCVQCTADTDCTGNKPVCETSLDICRACTMHDECASELCLPDGSCAAPDDVTYVLGGAPASTTCTQALPCSNFEEALVAPVRRYIKVSGAVTDDKVAGFTSRNATIFAEPGSSITRTTGGVIFDIKGTSNVTIHGLAIRNSLGNGVFVHEAATVVLNQVKIHGNAGDGITFAGTTLTVTDSQIHQNTGSGIAVTMNGTLTVTDSILYANTASGITATTSGLVTIGSTLIANNPGGGLSLTSDYAVTNSIISANGSSTSGIGGVLLATLNPSAVFQFNTVANNTSNAAVDGGARGINCTNVVVPVTNSILTNNVVAPTCTVTYSLTSNALAGIGNKAGLPMFVDIGIDPLVAGFYRIATGSVAKDSANPTATITVDIDGDPRPAGAADMGADEVP